MGTGKNRERKDRKQSWTEGHWTLSVMLSGASFRRHLENQFCWEMVIFRKGSQRELLALRPVLYTLYNAITCCIVPSLDIRMWRWQVRFTAIVYVVSGRRAGELLTTRILCRADSAWRTRLNQGNVVRRQATLYNCKRANLLPYETRIALCCSR